MKLQRIEISGFRGVRGTLDVPFGSAFTVITGRNGVGKSTVCDAIEFALTGGLSRFSSADVEGGERISDYIWCRDSQPGTSRRVRALFLLDDGSEQWRSIGQDGKISGLNEAAFYNKDLCPPDPLSRMTQTTIIRDELIAKLSTDMTEADRFDFVHKAIGTTNVTALEGRALFILENLQKMQRELDREYSNVRERVTEVVGRLSEVRLQASKIASVDIQALRTRLGSLVHSSEHDTQALSSAIEKRIRTVRSRIADLDRLRTMLLNLERQRVERDRLKQESERLSIRIGELQNALKAASRSFIETKDQLESAQQRRPVDASLAQLTEHGKRVGLQDGRCPLCGSPLVEHDFTGHIQIIENELAKRSADIQSLVSEHAQASTLEAEARRKYEATSLELSRCTAALQTITSGFESAQDTAARLGVDMNVEAINTSLQADRSDLSELERGFELLQAILASGRIADLEQSKLELDERSNGLAIRSNRLGAAAQNAKSAADSIKRVAWEIVDERLAALSPLLSEMYVRLRPHAAYSDLSYKMRGDVKRFLSFAVGDNINPRFTFSSGQRRALGLAFLLSVHLARPWCHLETLILDDPVQHIDDYRALHLIETLAAVRQLGRQIVCTVEDNSLAELLCRRLRSTGIGDGVLLELEHDSEHGSVIRRRQSIGPLPTPMLVSA